MKKGFLRAVFSIAMVTGLILTGVVSARAANTGMVENLKSTTHTLGTVNENSQYTVVSMAWEAASYTNATLAGYNFAFSTSQSYTVTEKKKYPSTTTGTDSSSLTGKDGVGYYFYVKAVFTLDEAATIGGVDYEAGEDYWGTQDHKGPYYIDDTAPLNPSVSINSGASSTDSINVTLTLGPTTSAKMNISNTSYGAGTWEDYAASKAWTLTTGDGTKTVYVQFKDTAENISQKSANIDLAVTGFSVSSTATTVTKGVKLTFTASGGTPDYIWSVIEEKDTDGNPTSTGAVATIAADPSDNTKGILTPVGAGTCKVKVTDSAGTPLEDTSSVITVTVLSISPSTATVAKGQTQQFSAENGTASFTWSITDGGAGTINSSTGLFTADATNTGTETITVTDANSVTATATVNVASASIEITAGGSQPDVGVGTAATNLEVKVTTNGSGAANYVVDFTVTEDPNTGSYVKGSFSDTAPDSGSETLTYQALTGGDGIASAPFFVGQKAGTYPISAACTKIDSDGDGDPATGDKTDTSVTNSPRTFTITGTAGDAAKIEYFSGGDQTGTPDTALTNPFVVLVTDQYANPKLGTTVTFAVTEGTGTLSDATDASDSNGKAFTTLTPSAGTNTVTATATGLTGSPVTFTASAGTKGDVNNDTAIDITDVLLVIDIIFGVKTPNALEFYAANVDATNETIDITDLLGVIDIIFGN